MEYIPSSFDVECVLTRLILAFDVGFVDVGFVKLGFVEVIWFVEVVGFGVSGSYIEVLPQQTFSKIKFICSLEDWMQSPTSIICPTFVDLLANQFIFIVYFCLLYLFIIQFFEVRHVIFMAFGLVYRVVAQLPNHLKTKFWKILV